MKKIGGFINPWGNGHFTRMMALDDAIQKNIGDELEIHYSSSGEIYQKLLKKFSTNKERLHNIVIPTPIDGKCGPSVTLSLFNLLLPVAGRPPLVSVMARYLIDEGKLYDKQKFDLVINDGDVGSNIIAQKRDVKSIFVTNQYRPRLWASRAFLYPGLMYISKNIAKASKIIVADSPPPYTICEYNLNFPERLKKKIVYVGHFSDGKVISHGPKSDLEKLIESTDSFGYWMITGNKSTNDATANKYGKIFHANEMNDERRIVSHAKNDPSLDKVLGKDGKTYSISEAFEKQIDWVQIDVGFLSEQEKDSVLNLCKYAVINGSHTAMGEILGAKAKPIIGIPVYDEHTNQIKWAEERTLGILATNIKQTVKAISKIHSNYNKYHENLIEFAKNYNRDGTKKTTEIISEMLGN
ncbi:MAG TPA: glycosyltransferase [Candidatus Nitrosotalea sp.]|nr:glycosyltransferase [Candidatus Nitrosotalea sp.]